jgi:PKD repeat protein
MLWSIDSALCTFDDATVLNPGLTCQDNGSFNATLTVADGVNAPVSDQALIAVSNRGPDVSPPVIVPEPSHEGSPVSAYASFSDAGASDAPFTCTVNYGDGSGDLPGTINSSTCAGPAYAYTDDGAFTVTFSISDKDGGAGSHSTSHIVENVPPAIEALNAPVDPISLGNQPFSLDVSFSDPGPVDTHAVTWDWGDLNSDTEVGATSPSTSSHTYAEAGVYTVQITVSDDDGGSDTEAYEFVVIYDPSSGFVTGGGWIWSASGWCQLDEICAGAEGKANFGFVSKYKKGASVPTGNTEFNFSAGGLNFHSASYAWLVVNQGSTNAQYKGSGTINGDVAPNGEPYKFMIWAKDQEGGDTFRIKIWYEAGAEFVVYDNGFDQAIGGGNIKIHAKK